MTTPTPAYVAATDPARPLSLDQARHLSDLVLTALAATGDHMQAVTEHGCGSDRVDLFRDAASRAHRAFLEDVFGLDALPAVTTAHLSDLVLAALTAKDAYAAGMFRYRRRSRRLARLGHASAATHQAFLTTLYALVQDETQDGGR
jgi:hypothetical protein